MQVEMLKLLTLIEPNQTQESSDNRAMFPDAKEALLSRAVVREVGSAVAPPSSLRLRSLAVLTITKRTYRIRF